MALDPDAETLLAMIRAAGRPPMETLSPDEARQQFKAGRTVTQPDPQDVAERDRGIANQQRKQREERGEPVEEVIGSLRHHVFFEK